MNLTKERNMSCLHTRSGYRNRCQTLRGLIRVFGGGGIVHGRDGLWNEVAICVGEQAEGTTLKGVLTLQAVDTRLMQPMRRNKHH